MKKPQTLTLNSRQFGIGKVSPVAYDTAWLARVPHFSQITRPAFPKALVWLRTHQLKNGSWGNALAFDAQGNLLSTLAAVLALRQWNKPQDQARIKKGLVSLHILAKHLNKKALATVGFELLLPALVAECEDYNLQLPLTIKNLAKNQAKKSLKKKHFIKNFHKKYSYAKPASWWFSLEMLGGDLLKNKQTDFPSIPLFPHGSLAASPSATAYLLAANRLRGKNLPKAVKYLQLSFDDNAGTQHVFPIDEFELSFSANYLLDAGVPLTNTTLKHLISAVEKKWQQRNNAGIGYSSDFLIDPDDTAVALRVLTLAGKKNLPLQKLLKFFNGTCIENFAGEELPAISANLHTLHALQSFPQTDKIKTITKKLLRWLENQQINKSYFLDKWHSSAIYPTARAIITLSTLHAPMAQRCVDWLIQQQHGNGGFGVHGFATAEETALASLALCSWHKHNTPLDIKILKKAQHYLQNHKTISHTPLWIGKVLYCPTLVVDAMINAAQYALTTAQNHLLNITTIKPAKFVERVEKHTQHWATKFNLLDKNSSIFKSDFVKCASDALPEASENDLEIYSDFGLLILTIDDIVDENWHSFTQKFKFLCLALDDIQRRLLARKAATYHFYAALQQWFQFIMKELQLKIAKKPPSLAEYFNIRTIAGGMDVANELAFSLKNIQLSEKLRKNKDYLKLKTSAYQALIIANDLFSFDKEMQHGDTNNYILIKQTKSSGSLEQIFQHGIRDYNECVTKFLKLKNQLLKNTSGKEKIQLKTAIELIAHQTQAHLDWALRTQRYPH